MRTPSTAACALGTFFALAALGAPPEVLSTSPSHGQAGVDPNTKSITATFSQPMQVGNHSWVGGGPTFPKLSAQPSWEDNRTPVLSVTLEPDHDYVLYLNNAPYLNFRSARGEPAVSHQLAFTTRKLPTTKEINQYALDTMREAILSNYSYRDRLDVNWAAHLDSLEENILASDSTLRLATRLADALAPAKDIHIAVRLDNWAFGTYQANAKPNFNGRVLSQAIPNLTKHSDAVLSGWIDDDTAYLLVTTWDRSANAGQLAADALQDLRAAKNLIIDVRPNGGGDELHARVLAACFTDEPIVYATNKNIDPNNPGQFTVRYERVLQPSDAHANFEGRVAVLMGNACMSSNEAFVLMMRAAGAALVGANTFGSSGNPQRYDLGSGVTITLPSWLAMTADGTPVEGVGVEPDIKVARGPREGGRRDPVLEAALRHLRARSP